MKIDVDARNLDSRYEVLNASMMQRTQGSSYAFFLEVLVWGQVLVALIAQFDSAVVRISVCGRSCCSSPADDVYSLSIGL